MSKVNFQRYVNDKSALLVLCSLLCRLVGWNAEIRNMGIKPTK